jgi:hypothetical protein
VDGGETSGGEPRILELQTLPFMSVSTGACYLSSRPTPVPLPPIPATPSIPTVFGGDLEQDCIATFNPTRFNENRGKALTWDKDLARLAILSADHCATVRQEHTHVHGSQILFITKTSCSASIKGWFHDEKPVNGGHYQIIRNPNLSRVGCAVSNRGRRCISCNFQ